MKTLYVTDRDAFRKWLEKNHAREKEIWLVFYKKHTGKPSIPYEDAVEEAICFGWIDSLVKRIDDETYGQKFTPRKPNSNWTELNLARAKKMMKAGRMTEAGSVLLKSAKKIEAPAWKGATEMPELPADLKKAINADKSAKLHFKKLTPRYVAMCLGWIDSAKKPETRARRITEFVDLTAKNERIGMK